MAWKYRHVHDYLTWYRKARAHTEGGGTMQTNWAGPTLDADGFREEFRKALDNRINLKVGPYPTGRKYDSDYQAACWQDSNDLRAHLQRRVRIYQWRTAECRARFSGLLARYDED